MRDPSLFFVGIFVDSGNGHSVSSEGFQPSATVWLWKKVTATGVK